MGITPKQVLHDVLTSHKHIESKDKSGIVVGKDRYNCDDENLVAESPFVDHSSIIELNTPGTFQVHQNLFLFSYYFLHQFFFKLRGPPSIA
jgi:hypothetical protein